MVKRRGVRGEAYSHECTRQVGKRSWWTNVADARYVPVYNIIEINMVIEINMIEPSQQISGSQNWRTEWIPCSRFPEAGSLQRQEAQYKHKTDRSGEDVFHNLPMDVSQSELSPLEFVRQTFMIDSHQVHERGLEIVNVHRVLGDIDA